METRNVFDYSVDWRTGSEPSDHARNDQRVQQAGPRRWTALALLSFSLGLAGCASTPLATQDMRANHLENIAHVRFTIQEQSNPTSCGAAVVASALTYWGIESTEAEILDKYPPVSPEGYSLAQLREIMEAKGLRAFIIRGNADELRKEISKGRPVILPIRVVSGTLRPIIEISAFVVRYVAERFAPRDNHFVVGIGYSLAGSGAQEILLADPASGIRMIDEDSLNEHWINGGVMLVFGKVQ